MKPKRLRNGYGKHTKPITLSIENGHPTATISLGKRKKTKISIADLHILEKHSFYAHQRADGMYVARSSQNGKYIHRLIMKPKEELEVDHVNADPLDNRRGNLRAATAIQNNLAKKRDLVYGYSGIIQTQKRFVEYKMIGGYKTPVRIKAAKFLAIGPDGKKYGPYFDTDSTSAAAHKAARVRDKLMQEEYMDHYEYHEHHNFGFIHWNLEIPKEAIEMDNYLYTQEQNAIVEGWKIIEVRYPKNLLH